MAWFYPVDVSGAHLYHRPDDIWTIREKTYAFREREEDRGHPLNTVELLDGELLSTQPVEIEYASEPNHPEPLCGGEVGNTWFLWSIDRPHHSAMREDVPKGGSQDGHPLCYAPPPDAMVLKWFVEHCTHLCTACIETLREHGLARVRPEREDANISGYGGGERR